MAENKVPRRDFLKAAGAAGAAGAAFASGIGAQPAPAEAPAEIQTYLVLTADEVAFLSAAVDTIIPADELSPSGTECGGVVFIDRQLASAWGGGAKMYRGGPYLKGTPEQGYQLPLTPHQFFVTGIRAANQWSQRTYGSSYDRLDSARRAEAMAAWEEGHAQFDDFSSRLFFQRLLQITIEGFFADPIYGGNRDKASWRMLGFPGLPAVYADKIEEYRKRRYEVDEPQSIADFS
jgi:gluconate 2-dehydrogenase gamma chain